MYKLVALDMDGTLLSSDKTISERNKQAIADAKRNGATVVLASGRPLEGMTSQLKELDLTSDNDFVICYNGSLVKKVSTGETVRQNILSGKDAKALAKIASEQNVYIHAFSPERGLITPENNPYTEHEAVINGVDIVEFDFAGLTDDEDIIKVMLVADKDNLDKATTNLPQTLKSDYTVVRSADIFLEFLNPDSNKGVGVQSVAELLNITKDQIICMGDAENDHHMIKYAGLGVAMANATEATKALADHITDSNDDSGVAAVIEEFVLKS
ncbi:Cof-type HAD-IIB family hydrolase [Vibrio sp. JC009]|uniref:Cof-type HAD-IIB family hydrolase n=1 Tax=Vibrio sp. JC009 TaxID=2912314 RepID=UPI0023B02679|nr:Cof-type HAD-IIB family hydrolase [Vibrio sp. JC009]WED23210.1 Cof-type HAD-IIB family hydrolase [Vibrio sp. JC009]